MQAGQKKIKECIREIIIQLIQPSFTECLPCTKKDITWLSISNNSGLDYLDQLLPWKQL